MKYPIICRLAVTLLVGSDLVSAVASDAFTDAKMTDVRLAGLRVRLGEPIQVTAQLAWQEGPNGRWVMNHPVPSMARFPSGELLVTYSLVSDYNDNPRNVSGAQLSFDGGRTWERRYDFIAEHQAMVYFPLAPSSLLAIPAYLNRGGERNFHAAYTVFEQGGRRVIIEPAGVQVVDWPWAVATVNGFGFFGKDVMQRFFPERKWTSLCFDGNALEVDGCILATAYGMREGAKRWENLIMASADKGRTWRYFSPVADATGMPEDTEGPNEIAMIQLADGDLMTVFRVGGGKDRNLRRAYSHDKGRSWSKPDALPAYSVEPSLLRVQNGVIALSTGRPGIHLWLATDVRAQRWQDVDVMAHHNRWAPDATYRIAQYDDQATAGGNTGPRYMTSSYTEIVEIAPNRLLLVYDRSPKPKPEHDGDLTRIFVLPIEIVRE